MKFYLALWYAKVINGLINLVSKGRGSNLSGEKALTIDPRMVAHFKGINYSKVVFITGTNGKSSTTNLVTHILRDNGKTVVSNLEGANLLAGIATILAKESNLTGKLDADYFVFETDERYLPIIYDQLPAENILITNLQKDQVQRNGDPDFIYRKLTSFMDPKIHLYLNNEEPRAKSFERFSDHVIYYGVEKHQESFMKSASYPTSACPKCHHKINFDYYNTDSVGSFKCQNCGYASEDVPNYQVTDINFENKTFKVDDYTFKMPYDLPFMFYNYSGALALCQDFAGISIKDAVSSFDSFENIGGRFEIFQYKDKTIKYMRIKQENPETLQSTLNIMASDSESKMICFGLYAVADFIPHYTNSFYAYDCDFKPLVESNVESYLCFSENVCYDTANRLIYEGVNLDKITIKETDDIKTIFDELDKSETKNIYLITWLETFEKMKKYIQEGN
ncbi:MAG: MurT ligase domain-containing protein [Eubacterium sp.]